MTALLGVITSLETPYLDKCIRGLPDAMDAAPIDPHAWCAPGFVDAVETATLGDFLWAVDYYGRLDFLTTEPGARPCPTLARLSEILVALELQDGPRAAVDRGVVAEGDAALCGAGVRAAWALIETHQARSAQERVA